MLDRKLIVASPDLVKQNCLDRGVPAEIDRIVELETQRTAKLQATQELNRQANEISQSSAKPRAMQSDKNGLHSAGRFANRKTLPSASTMNWNNRSLS